MHAAIDGLHTYLQELPHWVPLRLSSLRRLRGRGRRRRRLSLPLAPVLLQPALTSTAAAATAAAEAAVCAAHGGARASSCVSRGWCGVEMGLGFGACVTGGHLGVRPFIGRSGADNLDDQTGGCLHSPSLARRILRAPESGGAHTAWQARTQRDGPSSSTDTRLTRSLSFSGGDDYGGEFMQPGIERNTKAKGQPEPGDLLDCIDRIGPSINRSCWVRSRAE